MTGLTIKNVENISYVGSDNLGSAAYVAAVTAKDTAATALTAATNAKVAADALAVTTAQKLAAATYVATGGAGAISTVTAATTASSADLPTGITTFTKAQYNAAAAALKTNLDGTATTDGTIVARGTALKTVANLTNTSAANVASSTVDLAAAVPTGAALDALNKATYAYEVAAANLTAVAASSTATASIAANADATSITIDGVATTVTGLKDTQTVTVAASSAADTLKYAAGATVANLGLTSGSGTFTFADSSTSVATSTLKTASVSGSVKGGTAKANTGSTPGTVTLVDSMNGGKSDNTTDTIATLKLAMTSAAKFDVTGLTKLTAIDASASTGAVDLTTTADIQTVSTGSGDDTVSFTVTTDLANPKKLSASLATGAGKDAITVDASGAGPITVDAGEGDDSVTMTSAVGTSTIDGGAGKDTVTLPVADTSFTTSAYNKITTKLLNFEVLAFNSAASIDASKASQFSEFTFKVGSDADGKIVKVADTQTVNAQADVSVSSAGYLGKDAADANDEPATSTTYGGTLTIAAKGSTQTGTTDQTKIDIAAFANALNLTASTKGKVTDGVTNYTATNVVLTGDVKTATIVVNNSADNSKLTADNVTSTVTLAPTDEFINNTTGRSFKNLGNLASVTASGTGSVVIDNTDTRTNSASETIGTKLTTVDASGLVGTDLKPGATLGWATAGLNMKFGLAVESVKLGTALDTLIFSKADAGTAGSITSSTIAKMDSITGFTLVAKGDGSLWTEKSDGFATNGVAATKITGTYVAKTGSSVSGTLDAALTVVGALTDANVVFQNGGNTYIYQDLGVAGRGEDDGLIELVGLVDLDLLITDLLA